MDATQEFLKDFNRGNNESGGLSSSSSPPPRISEVERKAIQNCIFQHKPIVTWNEGLDLKDSLPQ